MASMGGDLSKLPRELADAQVDFINAEYEHLGASLQSNEDMGERRVNIFIGLIAAVTAAVGLAGHTLEGSGGLIPVLIAASVVLFLFGLITLRRVMVRNLATTEILNGLRRIRAFFALQQPEVTRVLPFVPSREPHQRRKETIGLGNAGYLEIVGASNSLLVAFAFGALLWAALTGKPWPMKYGSCLAIVLIVGSLAWFVQMRWADRFYCQRTAKADQDREEMEHWWIDGGGRNDPRP